MYLLQTHSHLCVGMAWDQDQLEGMWRSCLSWKRTWARVGSASDARTVLPAAQAPWSTSLRCATCCTSHSCSKHLVQFNKIHFILHFVSCKFTVNSVYFYISVSCLTWIDNDVITSRLCKFYHRLLQKHQPHCLFFISTTPKIISFASDSIGLHIIL